MRKAIWLLAGLFALFTIAPSAVAADGCVSLVNGKAVLEATSDGCTIVAKVLSTLTNACADLTFVDTSVQVLVSGDEGTCTGSAPLDTGDITTKTSCTNATNTKIEIKVHCVD